MNDVPEQSQESDNISYIGGATSLFNRRRPLFWLALAFCAGILLDALIEPRMQALGGLFLATFLGIGAVFVLRRRTLSIWIVLASGLCVALSSGMLLHGLRARIPAGDDISRRTPAMPSFVWLSGTVLEASRPHENGRHAWLLSVDALGANENAFTAASGRVQINIAPEFEPSTTETSRAITDVAEGDQVRLRVRLESPPEVTLPDSFDYRQYLLNQGIYRTGVIFPETLSKLAGPSWFRPDLILRRTSAGLADRLEIVLPDESAAGKSGAKQAGLLNALLFGRREHVDMSDRETFAISGMAHLLAISGLQIHFLALILWRLAGIFGISRRRSAWIVLWVCCGYCALAGGAAPILRATVMIAMYLGAIRFWREADALSVLGASALAILVASPAELFSAGFQLSFLAVLALATLYPVFEETWKTWRLGGLPAMVMQPQPVSPWKAWLAEYTRKALFVSLAATLGTAPVVAWHMGRFSTLTFAMNLVALPLGNICMVFGLLALAVSVVSITLASYLAWIAYGLVSLLEWMTRGIAAIPIAAIDVPAPPLPVILVYSAALFWIWVQRRQGMTFQRLCIVAPACLLVLNAGVLFRENVPAPAVTVLDLKFGRAALVESPTGGAALIDAGGIGQGARIAEMLRRQGISRLSLLVISVDEHDAIGGALDLLKRIAVQRVILPRAGFPSEERRDLERYMTQQAVPYNSPRIEETLQGPGDIRWDFCDDGPGLNEPAGTKTALSVRITLPGTRILFVPARSASSLQRLLAKGGRSFFESEVVRLSPDSYGRWPAPVSQLVQESGCRTVIAGSGSDPEEAPGLDLGTMASARDLQLLSPHRDGSVRIQADVGRGSGEALRAFRAGEWKEIR